MAEEVRFDPALFRLYDREQGDEFLASGYPVAWLEAKEIVRDLADRTCERCGHPYAPGMGEWSPCRATCSHYGPGRHAPTEVDHRPVPEGMPPHIDEDGWVYFDNGDVSWLVERGIEVYSRYRILTVHHLNGVKHDLRWWNLAALCQRCHLTIQGRVRLEQTYPWEHSEWFKPHAAGWYAFAYLDKDASFEETMDHLEEFLSLERAGAVVP